MQYYPTSGTDLFYTGAYPGTGSTLPVWELEVSYSPSTLVVYDYHGKSATCDATVAIWVRCSSGTLPLD